MTRDTGRADFQRQQAEVLEGMEKTQKALEGVSAPQPELLAPEVATETTPAGSEAA